MPQRTFSDENYRYGFNGQEKDDEIYGEGNLSSALFWEYDTRLGRRWNLDPKPQFGLSDYAALNDNPILLNDPNGDCPPGVKCADVVDKPEISKDNSGTNDNRVGHGTTRNHKGVDIIAAKGTDVRAAMGGEVVDVINNHKSDEYSGKRRGAGTHSPTTGLGNTVIIKTTLTEDYTYQMEGGEKYTIKAGETVFMKYSHLDVGYEIVKGKEIQAGQVIGKSGATGNPGLYNKVWGIESKYRHVHVEARLGSSSGTALDPEGFMFSTFNRSGNRIEHNYNSRNGPVMIDENLNIPKRKAPPTRPIATFYYKPFGQNHSNE